MVIVKYLSLKNLSKLKDKLDSFFKFIIIMSFPIK